jgi:hypothetical protein
MLCLCFLQAYKRWKGIELKLTDAANEANDNVRYLTTLERAVEVRHAQIFSAAWLLGAEQLPLHVQDDVCVRPTAATDMLLRTAMVPACRSCMAAAPSRCWTACAA